MKLELRPCAVLVIAGGEGQAAQNAMRCVAFMAQGEIATVLDGDRITDAEITAAKLTVGGTTRGRGETPKGQGPRCGGMGP